MLMGRLLALLCCVLVEVSWAAPRGDVERIAKVIEENYFDATRAAQIADGLRQAASKGDFDGLRNPRDLASALTRRLVQFDAHFRVDWSESAPAPSTPDEPPAPEAAAPGRDPEGRRAYGLRRVEVLPGAVGYVDLRSFAHFDFDDSDAPARAAAEAALRLIADVDAVIIDLRDNGGGSPAMAGYLVSAFTAKDADIYNVFRSRDGVQSERPKAPYPRPNLSAPLFVLISGRTGSAAEAFAYTLQAAKRAVIIGQPSAGAANPGDTFAAGGGFAVFVSTGSPRNPITASNWEGSGVLPDVAVAEEEAVQRAHGLALEAVISSMPNRLPRLDTTWTLEVLRASARSRIDIDPTHYVGMYEDAVVTIKRGELALVRGRRPAWTLVPLGKDVFYPRGEPERRVRFVRDPRENRIVQLELLFADGFGARLKRSNSGR